jgi:CDP-paratose 2-epimerase
VAGEPRPSFRNAVDRKPRPDCVRDRRTLLTTGLGSPRRRQQSAPSILWSSGRYSLESLASCGVSHGTLSITISTSALGPQSSHCSRRIPFDLVVHCAAQPSHDKPGEIPLDDFDVNAVGTVNLLEATRRHTPEAVFIFMSTNKVYGDAPNELLLAELETRGTTRVPMTSTVSARHAESTRACTHSSVHRRWRRHGPGIRTVLRAAHRHVQRRMLDGPGHSGVEPHGFLSYLIKVAARKDEYTVFGYKGKQVRDQIHSADVVAAFDAFFESPRAGEVYNLGGRPRQQRIDPRVFHDARGPDRPDDALAIPGCPEAGRPHLLLHEPREAQNAFSSLEITRTIDMIVDEILDAELSAERRGRA